MNVVRSTRPTHFRETGTPATLRASVIVPTLNRASALRRSLASFVLQAFPADQYEIIVVDNGSTDKTEDTVRSCAEKYPFHRIRHIFEPEPGLLSGRHRGAFEANGELFVFVDDDIEATDHWLAAIVAAFDNDENAQFVCGPSLPKYEVEPPAWIEMFWQSAQCGGRMCWYLSLIDCGTKMFKINPNLIFGLNFSIRRQAFYDLGGFHPDAVPDDLLRFRGDGESGLTMVAEIRRQVAIYRPDAIVHHFVSAKRITPEYFERRAYLQGISELLFYSTSRWGIKHFAVSEGKALGG